MKPLLFLTKKFILKLLLILWLIFSVGYIGWNMWSNFKNALIRQAYQQGVADAVNQLIQEAESSDCKSVRVFNKDQKKDVELINTKRVTSPK